MAIPVDGSDSTVIVSYEPPGAATGRLVSGAAALAVLALAGTAVIRRRKRPVTEATPTSDGAATAEPASEATGSR